MISTQESSSLVRAADAQKAAVSFLIDATAGKAMWGRMKLAKTNVKVSAMIQTLREFGIRKQTVPKSLALGYKRKWANVNKLKARR